MSRHVSSSDTRSTESMETQRQRQRRHHFHSHADPTPSPSPPQPAEENEKSALRNEVVYLKRKIQYFQSISTVFRQKISMIMRELGKSGDKPLAPEMQSLFAKALSQMSALERDDFAVGKDGNVVVDSSGGGGRALQHGFLVEKITGVGALHTPRTNQSKEDIRKAHHLCAILEEKNEAKAREVEARRELEAMQAKFDELSQRHQRFVELQSTGRGNSGNNGINAAAQAEQFFQREKKLQEQLLDAKSEILRLRAGKETRSVSEDVVGHASLQRQNTFLKSKVEKLKEELAAATRSSSNSAVELERNLRVFTDKAQEFKAALDERDATVNRLIDEKTELAKDVVRQRHELEMVGQRCSLLDRQARDARETSATTAAAAAAAGSRRATNEGTNANAAGARDGEDDDDVRLVGTIESMTHRIESLETQLAETQAALENERAVTREKSLQIASLGAQIQNFRARIDSFENAEMQKETHENMLAEVEGRLMNAVHEIKESQAATMISKHVEEVGSKLQSLEAVELQLRQKEDQLAASQDEIQGLRQSQQQMQENMDAVSTLLMQFPRSRESLEKMVIELEEFRSEVVRCVREHDIPDLTAVDGRIDLRRMEAEASRASRSAKLRKLQDNLVGETMKALQKSLGVGADESGITSHSQQLRGEDDDDFEDTGEGDIALLSENVPAPPDLVDLTAVLLNRTANPDEARSSSKTLFATPTSHRSAQQTQRQQGGGGGHAESILHDTSPTTLLQHGDVSNNGATPGNIKERDVTLTFQLFDEEGRGVLPIDTIVLCLTTLGLSQGVIPKAARAAGVMSIEEFTALCLGS